MPIKQIGNFSIDYMEILNEKGEVDKNLEPEIDSSILLKIYKNMLLSRVFDEKAISLQRSGRIGTYPSGEGQEANVGIVAPLNDDDWLIPAYRENASLFYRNVPMSLLLKFWAGREEGNKFPNETNTFFYTFSLPTQLPIAVGMAYASKLKKENKVFVAVVGEGATSEGDFHEALNFASIRKLPVIFVVANNQYALSTAVDKQSGSETFAQKAVAYGMAGIKIDGNDVLALYKATKDAAEKARAGNGPTLIEAYTYRVGMHTTADDATRYQSKEEHEFWKTKKDPIARFEKYLEQKKVLDIALKEKIIKECSDEVEKAAKEALTEILPDPKDMFRYLFHEIPEELNEQMEELEKEGKE